MSAEQAKPKRSVRNIVARVAAVLIAIALMLLVTFWSEIVRLRAVMTLFDADIIVENFRDMEGIFDTRSVHVGAEAHVFERNPKELPESYRYNDETKNLAAFLEITGTSGLAVVHKDKLVSEQYFLGNDETTRWISWSVAKSFVSALVGIAVEDGYIDNINDPVTKYVPALNESGYEGVPIKHVLQMSSGVKFDETYSDPDSDINRMGRALALNTPLDDFVASLEAERPSGTYHHYVSMDTQVLAMVLREATGKNLSTYLEEKIWTRIGMESDAYFMLDGAGMEVAFGGLNAVLRDYARFGVLYKNGGKWNGEQIVPAEWVKASVTPDAPHLQPGENPYADWVLGYGYQWWLPENPEGDFLAIGVYNQFIYIHPDLDVVIAKNSAYADYNVDGEDKELESIAMFRAIARHVAKSDTQ